MNGKTLFLLIAIGALTAGLMYLPGLKQDSKSLIGQTAMVEIAEAGMEFIARVDTGAASTSVHAEALRVDGDMVHFDLVNRDGTRKTMCLPIAKNGTVRNADGNKRRIFVEMTMNHEGNRKRVLVNLSERGHMTYALLLGRNWLKDDYIVDVSQAPAAPRAGQLAAAAPTAELPNLASNE
jgi:hypothetical protein